MLGLKRRITIVLATIALFAGRFSFGEDLSSSLASLPENTRVKILEAWESIDRSHKIPYQLKEDAKQSAALYILEHPDPKWTRNGRKSARDYLRPEYLYANRNSPFSRLGIDESTIAAPEGFTIENEFIASPNMDDKQLGEVIAYGAYKYRHKNDSYEFIDMYRDHYPEAAAIAREAYSDVLTKPDTYGARARRAIERSRDRVAEPTLDLNITDTSGGSYVSAASTSSHVSSSSGSSGSSSGLSSYSSTRSDPIGDFLGGLLSSNWLLLIAFLVFCGLGGSGGSAWSMSTPSPSPYTPPSYTYTTSYRYAEQTVPVKEIELSGWRS